MTFPVTEHTVKTARHTTGYLACGAEGAPLLIFCHGWPELSLSWRHQLPAMAALGFRCIAPDMRGYGRSSTYKRHEDFAQELIVEDMLELLASLGRAHGHDRAVWIGHDWGSPVVWNMAAHHPDKTVGVASLCVPYLASGFTLEAVVQLVDRKVYPEAEFPAGQWDYQFFYEESFDKACKGFEANIRNVVKALFRKGDPKAVGKPSRTASVRKNGGWTGGAGFPDLPRDPGVITEQDMDAYTAALTRNGFFGPDSWYMNHKANGAYAKRAQNGGKNPSWTSYEKVREVIEKRIFSQVEDLLPVISFGSKKDGETEKKHGDFVARMVERGYTERQVRRLVEWYMRVKQAG